MKKVVSFQNKTILVLGLARSGMSAAKLLKQLGAFVVINDLTPLAENEIAQNLQADGFTVITGEHPLSLFTNYNFDFVVKNPGIPYTNVMLKEASKLKIPILTEVELAWYISEAPIVGITGTNGKTTTTMMLHEILNHYKENYSVLSGNIGYPASTVAQNVTADQILTMELSSFQLMGIDKFCPHIAIITNIYDAHLDYHTDRAEYVAAKYAIQKNMTANNQLILNYNQAEVVALAEITKADVYYFARNNTVRGAYDLEQKIYFNDEYIMDVNELSLPGEHNLENALAAIVASKLLEVPTDVIRKVLMNFEGVPHRMQYVGRHNGVAYYNDSKATNILATKKALSGFDKHNLILIAGGLDRDVDFSELSADLIGLKGMVTFGETRTKLYNTAKALGIKVEMVEDVAEAARLASQWAEENDNILLSPANASWDQYPNFEMRGEHFIQAVKNLIEEQLNESYD